MLPTIHIEIEKWKKNEELNVYVSSLGRFKDAEKKDIPLFINQNGYFILPSQYSFKKAHRLVAETFLGKSELTIDHKDSNKRNNKLSNLEFVSNKENLLRAEKKLANYAEIEKKRKKDERAAINKRNKILQMEKELILESLSVENIFPEECQLFVENPEKEFNDIFFNRYSKKSFVYSDSTIWHNPYCCFKNAVGNPPTSKTKFYAAVIQFCKSLVSDKEYRNKNYRVCDVEGRDKDDEIRLEELSGINFDCFKLVCNKWKFDSILEACIFVRCYLGFSDFKDKEIILLLKSALVKDKHAFNRNWKLEKKQS